jgi:transcriptional regulator GlxA family with amidase domain
MDRPHQFMDIGILDYDGAQAAAILGMTDLLLAADRIAERHGSPGRGGLRVRHWSVGEDGRTMAKRTIGPRREVSPGATVIIVPPGLGEPLAQGDAAIYADWLVAKHAEGAILCSICKGAFILAATGLLVGREVTTHWSYEEQISARFPGIRLNTDRLIIDDGDILTAGGVMAWVDLGLILIERCLGSAVMADTARAFLVDPPGREQSFYSVFAPRLHHGDEAVLSVQHWLHATGGKEMGLADLARRAGLEQRTFLRRFQKATGHSSGEYIQRLRINKARDLLQHTRDPIDAIAWEVHYRDPGAFRKVFSRIVGLTPSEYRQRFRVISADV